AGILKIGTAAIDPILVRHIDTARRRQAEYLRAMLYAKDEELRIQRAMLSEREWAKIEERLRKVAKTTMQTAAGSSVSKAVPAPIVQAIVENLSDTVPGEPS